MSNKKEIMLEILNQSISLERNIGKLYAVFAEYYDGDKIFWERMSQDEEKHANVLEGVRPWVTMGADTDNILMSDLHELRDKNTALKAIIESAEAEEPTREIAFNLAHRIEFTASEIHFQKLMTETSDNKLLHAMQELCRSDKDHQKRIRKMMDTLNIEIIPEN